MVNESKIEEVRKAIRKSIKKQKMLIVDEPEFSGDPLNTITPEESEGDEKIDKRNQKQK